MSHANLNNARQAEFEYKLLGYTPEDFPGLVPYLPPLLDLPLLTGAPEEAPGPRPSCPLPAAALAEVFGGGMPEGLLRMPLAAHEIGSRCAAEAQPGSSNGSGCCVQAGWSAGHMNPRTAPMQLHSRPQKLKALGQH